VDGKSRYLVMRCSIKLVTGKGSSQNCSMLVIAMKQSKITFEILVVMPNMVSLLIRVNGSLAKAHCSFSGMLSP
jgi:hypothetical protein